MKKLLLTIGTIGVGLAPAAATVAYSDNIPKFEEYTLPKTSTLNLHKQTTIDAYKNKLVSLLNTFVDSENKAIDTSAISDSSTVYEAFFAFDELNDGTLKMPDQIVEAGPKTPALPAFDKWDTTSPEYTEFVSDVKSLFNGLFESGTSFDYSSINSISNSHRTKAVFDNEIQKLVDQAKSDINGNLPSDKLEELKNITVTNTILGDVTRRFIILNIISAAKNIKNNPVDLTDKISWVGDYTSADATLAEAIRLIKIEFPEFNPSDTSGNGWTVEISFPIGSVSDSDWSAGIQAAKKLTNGFAVTRDDVNTSTITGDTPTSVKANAKLLAVDYSNNLGSDASHIDVETITNPAATLYTTNTFNAIKQSYIDVISNPMFIDGYDGENINTKPFVDSTTLVELNAAWDAIDFHVKFTGYRVYVNTPSAPAKDYIEQTQLVEWVNEIKLTFDKIKENVKTKAFFAELDKLVENDDNDQTLIYLIQKISEDFLEIVNQ